MTTKPILIVAFGLLSQIQQPKQEDRGGGPLPLTKSSQVEVDHFDTGFYQPPVCDSEGNAYFRMVIGDRYEHSPLWKFSSRGRKLAEYVIPNEFRSKFQVGNYSIGVDGSAHAIAYDGSSTLIFHFDSHGKFENKTKLSAPEGLVVSNVTVFKNGQSLVGGSFESGKRENQIYVAMFSSDGTLIKEFKQRNADGTIVVAEDSAHPPDTAFALGSDGNAYAMLSNRVKVFSPNGELIRSFTFSDPEKDFHPVNMEISGATISIEFARMDKSGFPVIRFRTYDLQGELEHEFVPDETLTNSPICFSENEGYLFFAGNGSQNYFVRAAIH